MEKAKDDRFLVIPPYSEKKERVESKLLGFRGVSRSSGKSLAGSQLPRSLNVTVTCSHTFRFYTTGALNAYAVTLRNLFGICGAVCSVVNSTLASIAGSVKLGYIDVYTAVANGSADNPLITWAEQLTGYGKDVAVTTSVPAGVTNSGGRLRFRPPRSAPSSKWLNADYVATTPFLYVTAIAGSVIDVNISWTLQNAYGGLGLAGHTTAVVGTFYYEYLDAPSNNVCKPVGLPSTI